MPDIKAAIEALRETLKLRNEAHEDQDGHLNWFERCPTENELRDGIKAALALLERAGEQDGEWVLVPKEPVFSMSEAGRDAWIECEEALGKEGYTHLSRVAVCKAIFRAMCAARPLPPPPADGGA